MKIKTGDKALTLITYVDRLVINKRRKNKNLSSYSTVDESENLIDLSTMSYY